MKWAEFAPKHEAFTDFAAADWLIDWLIDWLNPYFHVNIRINPDEQGEFEFGEDPPGERVFNIQIEELKAKAAFACSQDQNHAWLSWKTLIEACLVVNGARHFQISQTKISWLNAPLSLKSLYLDELIFF